MAMKQTIASLLPESSSESSSSHEAQIAFLRFYLSSLFFEEGIGELLYGSCLHRLPLLFSVTLYIAQGLEDDELFGLSLLWPLKH